MNCSVFRRFLLVIICCGCNNVMEVVIMCLMISLWFVKRCDYFVMVSGCVLILSVWVSDCCRLVWICFVMLFGISVSL